MMDLGTDLVTSILSRIAWAILVEYFRVSCISLTSSTCLRVGPGTKFYDKRARLLALLELSRANIRVRKRTQD